MLKKDIAVGKFGDELEKNKSNNEKKNNKGASNTNGNHAKSLSKEKLEAIQAVFFKQNVEDDKRSSLNYATTKETLENLDKSPNLSAYLDEITSKDIYKPNPECIEMKKHEKYLHLVTYSNTNYYDERNPQRGLADGSWKKEFEKKLEGTDPSIKTVVLFGGNLLGEQWNYNSLMYAKYSKKHQCYLYFGLVYRKKRLKEDLKLALSHNVDIYLMNGVQEHVIMKTSPTNRDILQEVVDELNDKRIHYIKNISSVVNLVKNHSKGKFYATLGFQTNLKNKSHTADSNLKSALKSSGELQADAIFVCNANTAGRYADNLYFTSGQSTYQRTVKDDLPQYAPSGFDEFFINVANDHELEVCSGNGKIFSENYALENKRLDLILENEKLGEIVKEKIDEKLAEKQKEILSKSDRELLE